MIKGNDRIRNAQNNKYLELLLYVFNLYLFLDLTHSANVTFLDLYLGGKWSETNELIVCGITPDNRLFAYCSPPGGRELTFLFSF